VGHRKGAEHTNSGRKKEKGVAYSNPHKDATRSSCCACAADVWAGGFQAAGRKACEGDNTGAGGRCRRDLPMVWLLRLLVSRRWGAREDAVQMQHERVRKRTGLGKKKRKLRKRKKNGLTGPRVCRACAWLQWGRAGRRSGRWHREGICRDLAGPLTSGRKGAQGGARVVEGGGAEHTKSAGKKEKKSQLLKHAQKPNLLVALCVRS